MIYDLRFAICARQGRGAAFTPLQRCFVRERQSGLKPTHCLELVNRRSQIVNPE